ncbi:hypothetical protein SAMN05216207_103044 [Pseudonocardia ammonioxydans]|uniref:Uncharacterized protein n=1 Tax=Pseudonocardia ammonioxydans TaxID=260086 RepID=A0A1I5EDF2_PSUAM|nr:hypothetical protein SAMN05216207_103044 [Pseudonocardia ammonioxydans]
MVSTGPPRRGTITEVTEGTPACRLCGTPRPPSPGAACVAGWVAERDERGRDGWLCPGCARLHVRDIESKLDVEWW